MNSPHQTFRGGYCWFQRGSLLTKAASFCGLAVFATSAAGCFMAAMAVAPVAVQLVRAAGSGIASATKSEGKAAPVRDAELCDMGGRQLPPLIELRTDKLGTTLYRPINASALQSDPQITAVVNRPGNGGWKLTKSFTRMNFKPPLQDVLVPKSVTFLAYAPAEARNPAEHVEVDALNQTFGPNTGTFDWNARVYRYAAVHQLPCASPPAH